MNAQGERIKTYLLDQLAGRMERSARSFPETQNTKSSGARMLGQVGQHETDRLGSGL